VSVVEKVRVMEFWKIGVWLVATLGVAGTIALFVFAPGIASAVMRGVVRCFALVLSYRAGCALVAAILAALAADYWRHSRDDAAFAAQTAAFEKAQDDRDKRITQEVREDVWKEIANATAENARTDETVKGFTDALPQNPTAAGNPFLIGDVAADRLCKIAGQAQCGPGGDQGVPAARRPGRRATDQKFRLPRLVRPRPRPDQKGQ
jgi:uncharacterized membrane protein YraQ (UPF0718 family)